jgi:hypothetical protein
VAVRGDLSPGQQLAQAVHAAFQFSVEHPTLTEVWHRHSNYLVIVAAPDEAALLGLANRAYGRGIVHTLVREPDDDDRAQAIVLEPTDASRRLCSQYPLALRCPKDCVCEHCDPLAFHYERKAAAVE